MKITGEETQRLRNLNIELVKASMKVQALDIQLRHAKTEVLLAHGAWGDKGFNADYTEIIDVKEKK